MNDHPPDSGSHDDDGDHPIAVVLDIAEPRLRRRTLAALGHLDAIALVDDPLDADVTVTDDASHTGPRTVLLTGNRLQPIPASTASVLATDSSPTLLLIAIEATHHGLVCRLPQADEHSEVPDIHHLDDADADTMLPPALTAREAEVIQLLATGASNKAIARALDISVHTAKFHVTSITTKLHAMSRTEAVARAIRAGLVMS